MFDGIKNMFLRAALNKVREKMVNPKLEGIATVEELVFKGKELFLVVRLAGLEDRPVEITCSDIKIADDGGSIEIERFISNMPFVQNGLGAFLYGRSLELSDPAARSAAATAKKLFNL